METFSFVPGIMTSLEGHTGSGNKLQILKRTL